MQQQLSSPASLQQSQPSISTIDTFSSMNPSSETTETPLVHHIAQLLSLPLTLDEVLTRIMQQVERWLNIEAGFLFLVEPSTQDLVLQISIGDQAEQLLAKEGMGSSNSETSYRLKKDRGVAGQVALRGKTLNLTNQGRRLDFGARSILCVPLIWQGQVIGVLEVLSPAAKKFSAGVQETLHTIGCLIAPAIHNARLYDEVLAERDRVVAACDAARKELARQLHDSPIQLVSGMIMQLDFCRTLLDKNPSMLTQELSEMQDLAEKAVHQMRTMLFELRPLILETHGLDAALEMAVTRWQKDLTETSLRLIIEAQEDEGQLTRHPPDVERALFAVIQEAVHNSIKHAHAEQIVIYLRETSTGLYTTIADNGQGFDVKQTLQNYGQHCSLGMVNIRERTELIGGQLNIISKLSQGTQIRVYISNEPEERRKHRGTTGRLNLPK